VVCEGVGELVWELGGEPAGESDRGVRAVQNQEQNDSARYLNVYRNYLVVVAVGSV